ncbi:hypothetical protein B0H63DRAFT_1035 [Podospora didyma]|uniref:DUF7918 domain-containing protein n=1 Tax=Podospora didyma TaxID=330526 RepID=A0AAE0U6I8_9PEZI|nr:hypothetical protein B0H63DRAFT_1035 [Podospora didyma]
MKESTSYYAPVESSNRNKTVEKVAEKALKGKELNCLAGFTTVAVSGPARQPSPASNDAKKRPFAVFEFHYRTMDGLIKEGVIPRSTIDDRVQGMSEAEMRTRLAELLKAQEQQSAPNEANVKDETKRPVKRKPANMHDGAFLQRFKGRRLIMAVSKSTLPTTRVRLLSDFH